MNKTVLIISQTFVPDPAAVGQYMADLATAMAARGHRVRVYTQDRGYEIPSLRFPRREIIGAADVRRFRFASFGKKSIVTRLIGMASFMIQAFCVALFTPNVEGIVFSTSPPMIGLVVGLAKLIRRVPIAYWAMDLNPDQLYALGKLKPTDFVARLIESVNRFILRRSDLIITLDRFMAASLKKRNVPDEKLFVLPPWSHEEHLSFPIAASVDERLTPSPGIPGVGGGEGGLAERTSTALPPAAGPHTDPVPGYRQREQDEANPFRAMHHLVGKFVIMYSGNHSPSNPLDTLMQATLAFKDDDDLRFLFIGGGQGKAEIERFVLIHSLKNVICLPYQPLAELKYSLRAADVHVVSLGDAMVGVVHPCKIYGAMAVGRPVLFLGPEPSHIADLMAGHDIGWRIVHGDVAGAVATIRAIRALSNGQVAEKGSRASELLGCELSQLILQRRLCEGLEQTFKAAPSALAT